MARLFGLLGNRSDLAGHVFALEADALRVRREAPASRPSPQVGPLGWGIGFWQGGEVLMRRRPIDERDVIDVASIAADVKADAVVGHVRSATVGALRSENTHPFRYRRWLFAQTGTVSAFEQVRDRMLASVPDFLRSGIRGDTDAEILFHVFLSFLHDAGRLNDDVVGEDIVRDALRSTLAVVDGMSAEVGAGPAEVNVLVGNGDAMVALHRRGKMAYRLLEGREDAEIIIGDDAQLRRKTPELDRLHFVLLASDFDEDETPQRWRAVENRAIVTVTRGHAPVVDAL